MTDREDMRTFRDDAASRKAAGLPNSPDVVAAVDALFRVLGPLNQDQRRRVLRAVGALLDIQLEGMP